MGNNLLEWPHDFSAIEIETTDLNPSKDQITEIVARKYRNNSLKEKFEWKAEEKSIVDALIELETFIGSDPIVINRTAFFCPFMGNAFLQFLGKPFSNDVIDIQRLFKRIENKPTARMDRMIEFYQLSTPHIFNATEDIKSLVAIYFKLQEDASRKKLNPKDLKKNSHFTLKDIPGNPDKNDESNAFYGKKVSATGTLTNYTRKEIGQIINNIGGKFQMNPRKFTDYLIVGSLDKPSTKQKKAENLGISILSENEFLNMIAGYDWV